MSNGPRSALRCYVSELESSVSIWRNATCHISAIFDVSPRQCGCTQYIQLTEGVRITATESAHHDAQFHNSTVSNVPQVKLSDLLTGISL